MINYDTSIRKTPSTLDQSKKNILLIGKGTKNEKAKVILNPMNINNAKNIYGESQLYEAYKSAREITNDNNIYTVNCPVFTDFIEIIDSLVQYNFDFIVPIDIYLRDTFVNPVTDKVTYFCAYYLERLGMTGNQTTLIMTDRASDIYDDIDVYLDDMNEVVSSFKNKNTEIISQYGNNLVFILNNLTNNAFSHVILAASLSVHNFTEYPVNISNNTYFDIDYSDIDNDSICFYKYHPISRFSSVEQLFNFRKANDIYKKVLIDILIKHVVKQLDLSEFNGCLYNPYIKVQIENKAKRIMQELKKYAFVDYKIKSIQFVKTDIGVGRVLIDVAIVPYSILETINIFMEV